MDGAAIWRNQYNMPNAYVVSDHGPNGQARFSMVVPTPSGEFGTPQLSVLDPRTMQIMAAQSGISVDGGLPPLVANALNLTANRNATSRPLHPTVPAE